MSQILDVSYGIKLDSPLSPTLGNGGGQEWQLFRDVRVEDVMNAPSLSISLQTATDASAFLEENTSNYQSVPQKDQYIVLEAEPPLGVPTRVFNIIDNPSKTTDSESSKAPGSF